MGSINLFNDIIRNDYIKVKYNDGKNQICINGVVKKVDNEKKILYILNLQIPFKDIVEISKICL